MRDGPRHQATVSEQGATGSTWVVVGKPDDLGRFVANRWLPIAGGGPVLTDDYPDLTRVLRWGRG